MKKRKSIPVWQKIVRLFLSLFLVFALALLLGIACVFAWANHHIDKDADDALFASLGESQTTRIYAKTKEIPKENESYSWAEYDYVFGDENSIWAEKDEISPMLFDAFVAIEDKRFYTHDGVDWLRTGKAVFHYFLKGDGGFGGSTITQQVVKNVLGEREVTPLRKAKEILRAIRLEKVYSKEEILTLYANIIPLANACTGVSSAASFYFGKSPIDLSLLECATLVSITNSPSRYNPITHLEANQNRAKLILREMLRQGYITEEMYREALAEPLQFKAGIEAGHPRVRDWFTETVLAEVIEDLVKEKRMTTAAATRLVYSGGLQIMSTVDASLQKEISSYFENPKHFYQNTNQTATSDYAIVIIDPKTGYLLATAGNVGKKTANRIQNGIHTKHPPGSSLKPIALYLPLLEQKRVYWSSVFEDMPREIKSGDTKALWPKNSPDIYQGKITLADALAYSKNTVAVSLYHLLGAENIFRHLENLGMTQLVRDKAGKTDLAPAPLALGQLTEGVSLRTLTEAYSPLAGQGVYTEGKSYEYVLDAKGNALLQAHPKQRQICSPQTAFIMTKMLQGVTEHGTAKHLGLKYTVDVAGKTGTSGGDKDRWFVGYTPEYLCGVRCSSKNGNAIGDTARSPLYVWDDCMKSLYGKHDDYQTAFTMPQGVLYSAFCVDSGDLLSEACLLDLRGARVGYGYFTPDNRPTAHCSLHREVFTNPFDNGISLSPHPFGFLSSSFSLLDTEKTEMEDKIKTLDRPYRLWYYISKEAEEHQDPTEDAKGQIKSLFPRKGGFRRLFHP